jgi:hypothetical protein
MTDYTPMPGNVVKLLGNVLAKLTKFAATLRTTPIIRLVNDVDALQVSRKWFASRWLPTFKAVPLRCIDGCRAIVGLKILETQLQLFDLPVDLLRLAPELHALELRDPQLQVLDLERPVRERLLKCCDGVAQIRKIILALT